MREEYAGEEDLPAHTMVCVIAPEPHAVLAARREHAAAPPQARAPSLFSLVRSRQFELLLRRAYSDSQYTVIAGELSAPEAHEAM